MRLIQTVIFLTLVTAIVVGLHLYFCLRLVHDPALPAPWGLFVRLQQPLLSGLPRRSATWAYVSQGTGFWGTPMRLGTRSEISVIRLRREC